VKILHTEASCGWGGQEIRILEESRGLIGRGHKVTVACPAHARMAVEAARFEVPVVTLPIEFKTIAGFRALRGYLAHHAPDVVNTHSSADSWLTGLACATLVGPPAIVRTRHISAPVSGNPFNRWLYRRAKAVVTTGESLRRHLLNVLDLDPARVVSVPTGIDTKRFSPVKRAADKAAAKLALGLDPALRYVGIVATLRSWKGHLFLLDAFARLQRPGLHLLIVGEGPMRGPIEEKLAALGLGVKRHADRPAQRPGTLVAGDGRLLPAVIRQRRRAAGDPAGNVVRPADRNHAGRGDSRSRERWRHGAGGATQRCRRPKRCH